MKSEHRGVSQQLAVPPRRSVELHWFVFGCFLFVAALGAFFWGFSLGTLTEDQRFLLLWLLPITSGFACGCFAGSLNVTGTFGAIVVTATGGFGVFVITFFFLPRPVGKSVTSETPVVTPSPTSSIATKQFDIFVGETFDYTIEATGTLGHFRADPLPPNLKLDVTRKRISGVVSHSHSDYVETNVDAYDASGSAYGKLCFYVVENQKLDGPNGFGRVVDQFDYKGKLYSIEWNRSGPEPYQIVWSVDRGEVGKIAAPRSLVSVGTVAWSDGTYSDFAANNTVFDNDHGLHAIMGKWK